MPSIEVIKQVRGLGSFFSSNATRTETGGDVRDDITIPVGYAGTLTTRTDNETGTLTLGAGHGITTGQIIDVYWSGGVRYNILVGTVSGTSVPIGADNSGAGDNLPAQATAIVASPRVGVNVTIDGDELSLLVVQQLYAVAETAQSHVQFNDAEDTEIAELNLPPSRIRDFDIAGGDDNPFTGTVIAGAIVSNGSATNPATFQMMFIVDATP